MSESEQPLLTPDDPLPDLVFLTLYIDYHYDTGLSRRELQKRTCCGNHKCLHRGNSRVYCDTTDIARGLFRAFDGSKWRVTNRGGIALPIVVLSTEEPALKEFGVSFALRRAPCE